jgi:hypothetical protein
MGGSLNYIPEMRKVWKQTARKLSLSGKYYPATVGFESIISSRRLENRKRVPPSIRNWIAILDEIGLLLFTLYLICFTHFMAKRKPSQRPKSEVVSVFLLGGIVTQLVVVRGLVLGGFDANAKHSARLLSEYVDLFNFLHLNPSVIDEFHASHTSPIETNAFWYKYISKGKLRLNVRRGISETFPVLATYLDEMEDWRTEELRAISAFAHPSFIAAYESVSVGGTYNMGGTGCLGRPDLHSVRTLRFVFYSLAEFLMLNVRLDFAMPSLTARRRKKDDLIPSMIERKLFVTQLMLHVIQDIDHRALSVPKGAFGRT